MQAITSRDQHVVIPVGWLIRDKGGCESSRTKLWVTSESKWVPTVNTGQSQMKYLQLTKLSNQIVIIQDKRLLGYWMYENMVPRSSGYGLSGLASLQ